MLLRKRSYNIFLLTLALKVTINAILGGNMLVIIINRDLFGEITK